MATSPIVSALRQEIQSIDRTLKSVNHLRSRKQKLESVLREYGGLSLVAKPMQAAKKTAPKKAAKKPAKKGEATQMQLAGVRHKPAGPTVQRTSMDLVREILNNRGEPMKPQEINKLIVEKYHATPASTLTQMLYKRSRANSGFFRTEDGRYGLLTWRGQQSPQQAA